ncbi:MAG: YeeE/YedE family protein [Sphingomonadales bacterium]|nr:YeeE/YedE family protein [Sphingomonadales bacterium]
MPQIFAALASGILFGLGLGVSRMIDPSKVQGFLDVAGAWDATLLVVMVSALAVYAVGYRLVMRRPKPILGDVFHVPTRRDVDARLVLGSAIFGIGWGLAGFCPGPALTALVLGRTEVLLFIVAMLVGAALHDVLIEGGKA